MPYIVREGDPLPWFQGTSDALGSLIDVAMQDRRGNQAAARDEAAFSRQRQAAGEDYTRNRAAAKEDYTTRQADENTRDERNYNQQTTLQGMSQSFQQQQAEAARAASLAENERRRSEESTQAAALAQAGGLPVEASMPDGVAGPGTMMDYGKVGTQGVGQLIGDRRMREQNAAMMGERAIDNERQDVALEGTEEYRKQMLELRRKQMETSAQNKKPVQSPDQKVAHDKAQKFMAGYISQLQKSMSDPDAKDELDSLGLTQEVLRARIEVLAETVKRNMGAPMQPAQQQGGQYPPDVLTEEDRAEYDALRAEESGGF